MLSMPLKFSSVAQSSGPCRLLISSRRVASSVEFWSQIRVRPATIAMAQSIQSQVVGGLGFSNSTLVGTSLSRCLRPSAVTVSTGRVCIAHLSSQASSSTESATPTPAPASIKPGDWSFKNGKVVREGSIFQDFLGQGPSPALVNSEPTSVPYLAEDAEKAVKNGRMYVETYGCQMNVNDMEIVLAIMKDAGYNEIVYEPEQADIIFINTCAIRENAEHKVWQRLNVFRHMKRHWNRNVVSSPSRSRYPPKVAVLGCMAERLKVKLLESEKMVDVVCGPDAYRDLPRLLSLVDEGQTGINTMLSLEETYADVSPVRLSSSQVSAYVSIMRGCNNMCSFCIVPFTRGRERSRPVDSIVREVGELWEQGVKEVVLLGQNVNSYNDISGNVVEGYDGAWIEQNAREAAQQTSANLLSPGFTSISNVKEVGLTFAHLLDCLSTIYPQMRFRFTSPHPKHFPEELLYLMKDRPNICKAIHLPAQSGSSAVLERMRRGYTREAYLELVDRIRTILPEASISSDFITGFCGETEEDHQDTLSLVETVGYDMAYMFAYSMREKTHAHRNYEDDVPEDVKQRRLAELITTFRGSTGQNYKDQLGTTQLVLIEAPNKRNPLEEVIGRTDRGHKVVLPNIPVPDALSLSPSQVSDGANTSQHNSSDVDEQSKVKLEVGDYVEVHIVSTTLASLRGNPICRTDLCTYHSKSR
ncbi:tRNA-2-methylthio-N6-dimethylallyladenosine synthase [Marchantia polymorpha subsp. ruderalis]